MTRFRHILLLCLVLAWNECGVGQESRNIADTSRILLVDPGISMGRPVFMLPPSLDERPAFMVPPFFHVDEAVASRLPFVVQPAPIPIDMLLPLRLQQEREARLSPLYTVLGAVELGGVAYLAYRHVKKYGFLK